MSRRTKSRDPLQSIPGIGPNLARHLREIGFNDPSELRNQDAERMYAEMCERHGRPMDRCVLYAFRCAVYYASTDEPDPELLKWWRWKDARLSPKTRNFKESPPRRLNQRRNRSV